jgi:hypothetical protein
MELVLRYGQRTIVRSDIHLNTDFACCFCWSSVVMSKSAFRLRTITPTTLGGGKYVVPIETSSHQELPGNFSYRGETVSFADTRGTLQVNGRNYGGVKAGDVVDLTTQGKVLVNGTERLHSDASVEGTTSTHQISHEHSSTLQSLPGQTTLNF